MIESLKKLWESFDFHIPQNINDISPGFITVVIILLAAIISIVAIIILSSSKKENDKYIPTHITSKFIPTEKNDSIREKIGVGIIVSEKSNDSIEVDKVKSSVNEKDVSSDTENTENSQAYIEPTEIQFKKKEKIKFEDIAENNESDDISSYHEDVSQYAIKSTISYTTSFDPIKADTVNEKTTPSQTQPKDKKTNPVRIVDGYAIINSSHREKLEKSYSLAMRRCIVSGTSEDLEKLLEAKKYIGLDKIEQTEFKNLLALISPK